ncbi:MAG: type II toxin-antitoxin system PrlF family antitoxin [Phormidium sp. BM_Day4_Bin.17]|nr:type II toxin-antitoxin system PrlF family antitoxin [Phormidium sp. BM_Day4_Bin.17]UCJ11704.1 MAG: type II toxin-antitoxin system PrlF family antitoxin [Phormidium sp. PBR-2020]
MDRVLVSVAQDDNDDPILGAFLEFLARDIAQNPQCLQPVSTNLLSRVQSLLGDVDVSLDEPLADEDE